MTQIKQALLILSMVLAGCGNNLYFSDDEGGARGGGSIISPSDELSLPYAQGTKVHISLRGTSDDMSTWRVRSDNPAVLAVEKNVVGDDRKLVAECLALGEGETRIRAYDHAGREVREARVTVKAPDRARMAAHGPLRLLGRRDSSLSPSEIHEARVLQGGKGVFAVAYYRGEERVYGRGIANPSAPAGLSIENATTRGVITNEWLFLSPKEAGTFDLTLRHSGRAILTVPITSVPETDIKSLTLRMEQVPEPRDDDPIFVLAQARDGAGREIYGAYCDWTLAGAPQQGPEGKTNETRGDMYRYKHAGGAAPRDLVASRGALRSPALPVRASTGFVTNTTYLGCSAAPSHRRGTPGVVFLALVAGWRLRGGRRGAVPR